MMAQRGMLLLPVALMLAVVGTLTYTMTREGSMSLASVNADYETEAARYLAEGGARLAIWQNERIGCSSEIAFGKLDLPGIGSITSGTIKREGSNTMNISVSATTPARPSNPPPAEFVITGRKVMVHKRADLTTITLNGAGGNDTSIKLGVSNSLASAKELELSDGKAHALIRFSMPGDTDNAVILSAQLKLVQLYTDSTQPGSLAVHRVMRDWGAGTSWDSPWSTPGGDYAPSATASVAVGPELKEYGLPIEGLVQSWANKTIDDKQGVLLKPSGMLNARFHSLDAATTSNKPKLVVRYYPRC